jgi:hypothetical protein
LTYEQRTHEKAGVALPPHEIDSGVRHSIIKEV